MTVLIETINDWYCPKCGKTDQTKEVKPHSRFHTCPKLGMLTAPLLPVGTKAKVFTREREDYVNGDKVRLDASRRPVMSIVTEREDGTDAIVFAPTATAKGT